MIINNDLIKKIRDYFSLNIYETKVWLALLSKGVASAGEIAEISGVPRSRTYDVLETLEKQGYVIQKIGKPVKFMAVKPQTVVESLKVATTKDAEEKVETLENLRGTKEYEQLEVLHNSSSEAVKNKEISSAIKGKTNIYSHVYELIENANKEVLISISYEELMKKEKMYKELFKKVGKDIKIKIAINGSDKDKIKSLEEKFKLKFYTIAIKSTFFIIDREQTLFPLNKKEKKEEDIESEDVAIWLNSAFFSEALAYLFELGLK
jgi:sugar-specific transcriptional regulator TrmB